jgi:hypothetical protein
MVLTIAEGGHAGVRTVEHTLTRAFLGYDFRVLEAEALAVQAAPPLAVDVLITGHAQVRCEERDSPVVGGPIQASIADVTAHAVRVHSGEVIASSTAQARAWVDPSGTRALEKAAVQLADSLGYMVWNALFPRPQCRQSSRPRKRWAVVIGIDTYQHTTGLHYAVNGATEIAEALAAAGFDVLPPFLNHRATRQALWAVLHETLPALVEPEDQVVIFYSGHGYRESMPDGTTRGYLLPMDGAEQRAPATAIALHRLQQTVNALCTDHILVLLDACFSGLLPSSIEATPQRSWLALTAGRAEEPVFEIGGYSAFTLAVLEGLRRTADRDNDGVVMASELAQEVTERVPGLSNGRQHPVFAPVGRHPKDFPLTQRGAKR